jgi:two-component system, OmpR family, phosphate regulon sensor histidine kinase PhoR
MAADESPGAKDTQLQLDTLRAVVDGMAEGVWITSEDGTVLRHNDALQEMLFTGTELVGKKAIELLPNEALAQAVSKACKEGQPTRLDLSVEGVRPRQLEVRISPLGPELRGSAAVFHDVTELRRLEKVRTDFVANVSHELRTPITAIRGYAETLKSGALQNPQVAANMVDIIHRQSERLSELVEDLLELSRIEARQIQLAKKPIALKAAVQRAGDAVVPKAQAKGVKVTLEIPEGLYAEADERAVEQVLVNLLDNAVKYTPSGGTVAVKARRAGANVELEVKDTGMGIEPKHLPRIFERFYRVDKGRSREMGGTGLGLSIVKHLADAMGGDVRVESQHGEGSTFFVVLPFSDGKTAAPAPSAPD